MPRSARVWRTARHTITFAVVATTVVLSAPTVAAGDESPTSTAPDARGAVAHTVRPRDGRTTASWSLEHGRQVPTTVPGQLIVKYRPRVSASARAAARSSVGGRLKRPLHARGLELLAVRGDVPDAVRALERRAAVLYAEPNVIYRATATPDDPRFMEQWALQNTGQTVADQAGTQQAGIPGTDIDAPPAWERGSGDAAVSVAVVDSGVAYDHPDLAGNIWSNPAETLDGLDDDGNGYVDDVRGWDWVSRDNDPRDLSSHGTHVAGTIGAVGDNGTGVTGVAWDVSIMPLRVLNQAGEGTEADLIDALSYAAAQKVDVVNMSLDGAQDAQGLADVIASAPDTLFVVAAGNHGADNDAVPDYPCSLTSPNIVCVAASDNRDRLAGFSNFGATSVDLAAPGVGILSTVPSKTTVRSEGFNTSTWTDRWTTGGTNKWGIETDTNTGRYVTDSPGRFYAANADTWLRTATPINLTGRYGCTVDYWMWLETEQDYDQLVVETSPDGRTWTTAESWTGSTGGYWYSFSDYLGEGGSPLYLRFRLESDGSTQQDGVGIDDVHVNCLGARYTGDEYAALDGTSMASPHVAGAAAVLFAAAPGASVEAVRGALLAGTQSVASLAGKTVTGGRLDLERSLDALVGHPPVVAFQQAHYTVDESSDKATVTVTRSGDTSGEVGVGYAVSPGTATADSDFVPTTGTLSFARDATTASFTVDVLADDDQEPDETLSLSLTSPTGDALLGTRATADLTIKDDDSTVVAFARVSRTVEENAGRALLTVTRTGNTSIPASVRYTTSGSAKPGADFELGAGTLEFAAGQMSAAIPVSVRNDGAPEAAESVKVRLGSPGTGTVLGSPSSTTLTIAASDQRPDAWVSTSSRSGYVGNNVYNTTGAKQTKTLTARRGLTRTFYVRVYNDGNATNTFTLKSSPAVKASQVRYLSRRSDVTSAMRSRAGYRVKLRPGAYRLIEVQTKILAAAALGSLKPARVTGTWSGDGTRSDLAKALVKVVR